MPASAGMTNYDTVSRGGGENRVFGWTPVDQFTIIVRAFSEIPPDLPFSKGGELFLLAPMMNQAYSPFEKAE